jgi:hypothetical protein
MYCTPPTFNLDVFPAISSGRLLHAQPPAGGAEVAEGAEVFEGAEVAGGAEGAEVDAVSFAVSDAVSSAPPQPWMMKMPKPASASSHVRIMEMWITERPTEP